MNELKKVSLSDSFIFFAGYVRTPIFEAVTNPATKVWNKVSMAYAGKSALQGAQCSLHCVLTDENINGKCYWDCGEVKLAINSRVGDEALEKEIYNKTKEFLKL